MGEQGGACKDTHRLRPRRDVGIATERSVWRRNVRVGLEGPRGHREQVVGGHEHELIAALVMHVGERHDHPLHRPTRYSSFLPGPIANLGSFPARAQDTAPTATALNPTTMLPSPPRLAARDASSSAASSTTTIQLPSSLKVPSSPAAPS